VNTSYIEDFIMLQRKRLTRRKFLKGATGAVFGAPLVISSSALGAGGATAPSERITLGFIGTGWRGHYHIRNMLGRGEVQVLAVCDPRESSRRSAKELVEDNYSQREEYSNSYKGVGSYNDFRELLTRDDVNAVMITLPTHWHAIPAIQAAEAGKDIYGEKPLSFTIREARAMVSAVRRAGRVFQTGSQQRSSWGCRFACEMVRSGRIGQLETVHVNMGGPPVAYDLPEEPVPEGFDWDMWLGPAPWRPFNARYLSEWCACRDLGGGGVTNMGAHYVDIAQWGMGTDHTGPVDIIPPDGKDHKLLTWKYANGVTMYHGGGGNGTVFIGTEGKIEATHEGHVQSWPESIMRKPIGPGEVHLYNSPDPNPGENMFGAQLGGYTPRHYTDWLRAIRTRQKPVADVEIGCRSVTVCHLANIAYRLNRPLKWDPVKEQFIGDPAANRWLDRPGRPPWTL
jgi:predicted dehydrogenase